MDCFNPPFSCRTQIVSQTRLSKSRQEHGREHSLAKNDHSANLSVEYQPVCDLKPFARNSRTHSRHQIRQIADSIKAFGFTNPVLVDKDNIVVAGHGRVAAAKLLGMAQVPTIRLENLSADQVRAYVICKKTETRYLNQGLTDL